MFSQNESTIDRVVRAIVGIILIYAWYAPFVTGTLAIVALVVGVVFLLTGIIGWCPLYSLFKMGTYKT